MVAWACMVQQERRKWMMLWVSGGKALRALGIDWLSGGAKNEWRALALVTEEDGAFQGHLVLISEQRWGMALSSL